MLMNARPVKRDKVGRVREHGHERQTSQKKMPPPRERGQGSRDATPGAEAPKVGYVYLC